MTTNELPLPISWPPSQHWEIAAGGWSSFILRVGTPAQDVRVLISTAGQATWVVSDLGCPPPPDVPASCNDTRGGLFESAISSTWNPLGNNSLGLETNLYPSDNATFGLDTVALGLTNANGGPTIRNQIVAAISGNEYVTGMFGLGQQPTNLSDFSDPHPSFLTSLYSQHLIPSLTWSYTAGAKYRRKGVLGSLTLGGKDAARFYPNDVTFDLASDISRDLVVGLQSITSIESNGSTNWLLPSAHFTFIDSTIPYIYLPRDACKMFERVFGLVWNSTYGFYLVDDALHRSLLTRQPMFTFTIANSLTEGPTVDIVLPYSSFDLGYIPDLNSSTPIRYFPIQPADNDTQLALGLAFLQEAYVTTDYQRGNFSVSQCNFEESSGQSIVPIVPLGSRISTTSPQSGPSGITSPKQRNSHLTNRELAGIISGAIFGALLLFAISYWLYRHWRSRRCQDGKAATSVASTEAAEHVPAPLQYFGKLSELEPVPGVPEVPADPLYMNQELPGDGRAEIQGRGMSLGLLRSICSLTPMTHSRPRSSIAMLRRDRRRYGKRFSTSDLLFTGNMLRYLAKLDARKDSRSTTPANHESVSTVAQVKQLYLDDSLPEEAQSPSPTQPRTRPVTARLTQSDLNRPLPPTPIFESPQRFSHLAWMRIGARYNEEQIRRETQYSHPPEMSQWTRTTQDQMGWF